MLHSPLRTDKGADDYNVGIAIGSSILVGSRMEKKKRKKEKSRR